MTNTTINLEALGPNFHVLNGALGSKMWFSYGTLIATKISDKSNTVIVAPERYSATTDKHLAQVRKSAELYGYDIMVAESVEALVGWAA